MGGGCLRAEKRMEGRHVKRRAGESGRGGGAYSEFGRIPAGDDLLPGTFVGEGVYHKVHISSESYLDHRSIGLVADYFPATKHCDYPENTVLQSVGGRVGGEVMEGDKGAFAGVM